MTTSMTLEERAVCIAKLRIGGMHPDWIRWFSRHGDEANLTWVTRLFESEVPPRADLLMAYKKAPDTRNVQRWLAEQEAGR